MARRFGTNARRLKTPSSAGVLVSSRRGELPPMARRSGIPARKRYTNGTEARPAAVRRRDLFRAAERSTLHGREYRGLHTLSRCWPPAVIEELPRGQVDPELVDHGRDLVLRELREEVTHQV